MIMVRRSTLDDDKDFAKLFLISAPFFQILFGRRVKAVLQDLFGYSSNLFSLEHVYFAEIEGKKAGMILGYDWRVKERENLRTGLLLFKKIGFSILGKLSSLMKFNATIGKLHDGEYYISNIAIYPTYRGMGIGKRLMLEAENEAKIAGVKRIVLDVEKENIIAMNFYKELGYDTVNDISIPLQKDKILHLYRMIKEIR